MSGYVYCFGVIVAMDAGMYKALSGAVVQMRRLEITSQDLANVNTSGYKGQRLAFNEVLASRFPVSERSGGFVAIGDQRTSLTQGVLQATGSDFHLAVEGDGYFVVRTPQGERYTRHGSFTMAADGTVITPQGDALLSEGGPFQIAEKMEIAADGTITSNEGELGKLRIIRFVKPREAIKEGTNLFKTDPANVQGALNARVFQGNLEQSNVSPIDSMTSLITINRQFEAYQRAMKLMDTATDKMIAEGAR
jgi:flagellar basal-body rod protein FlgF